MEQLIIRAATEVDIPAIVDLLRLSLGESLMPKSEAYWRWKHVENPFGPSPVLLAEDDGKLVGVRAFIRWDWKNGNDVIKAVRAVDTATHPDYQGKGIFKKMTLQLVNDCQINGSDMIFNTPNEKSKPGYLKMGWKLVGRLPVKIAVSRPLNVVISKLIKKDAYRVREIRQQFFSLEEAFEDYKGSLISTKNSRLQTLYSHKYLKWRYINIPNISYHGHANDEALVIFRLKQSDIGLELRITDTFGRKKDIEKLIKEINKEFSFDYMSISGFSTTKLPGILRRTLKKGPQTTVRNLNLVNVDKFMNFNRWSPSLGDFEVF